MTGTVLILGASGRFGRHAADAFWNAGWRVRSFDRSKDTLEQAAQGADVIVNAWNPAYTDWATQVPGLTRDVIAAAKSSGATVIIPGNVYVYGEGAGPLLSSSSPKAARNPLGRVRIEMESAYKEAGIPTIILRAGDFIDTEISGNWLESFILGKVHRGQVTLPGPPNAPRAWAYLPDLAETAVLLAERREMLDPFQEVLFDGFTLTLDDIADLAERVLGHPLRRKAFPWWMIHLAAPVWPLGRHLLEMRYLWSMPHRLDGQQLDALLPMRPRTDPFVALARRLRPEVQVHPDQTMPRRTHHLAAE